MSEPLQSKRGFVWAPGLTEAIDRGHAFTVHLTPTAAAQSPVLLIPEPDRAPTEAEVYALAVELFPATTRPARVVDWPVQAEVARAAWRLGARVPS